MAERTTPTAKMVGRAHVQFLSRTVLVRNNEVDGAYRFLDRILRNEGIVERARRCMYYEKPYQTRNRLAYERCKKIYDDEMNRKIQFLMRKNRVNPFPR